MKKQFVTIVKNIGIDEDKRVTYKTYNNAREVAILKAIELCQN